MKINLSAVFSAVLIALLSASIPAVIVMWADVRELKAEIQGARQDIQEMRHVADKLRVDVAILEARGRANHSDREYLPLEHP